MTSATCGAHRRYGSRSARSTAADAVIVTARSSVFAVARPRPGKCLNVALTPAAFRPPANAHAVRATARGSAPNERDPRKLPWSTPATGARSGLMPRRRSARPVAAPSGGASPARMGPRGAGRGAERWRLAGADTSRPRGGRQRPQAPHLAALLADGYDERRVAARPGG